MTSKTITRKAIREQMAKSYRESKGETVTVVLDKVTITAPAFIDHVNTGATILGAIDFHRNEWGLSLTGATKELAVRFSQMLENPKAPRDVREVVVHWVLDLNTLVTGDWLE